MHELPYTEALLDIVLHEAKGVNANKVNRIDIIIGRLSGIMPECVQFAFDVISRKTIAEGAKLEFHRTPGKVRCRNCGTTFSSQGFDDLACPDCKDQKIVVLAGREFIVDSIACE